MQKFLGFQVAVLLVILLSGTQVDAFAVGLALITITGDFEDGGSHEIGIVCVVGDEPSVVEPLPQVVTPGVLYELDPFIVIDEDLGPNEVHECLVVELDSFEPGQFNDVDREDLIDDPVCTFTIQQSDFHIDVENASVKEGDACVVGLVCANC